MIERRILPALALGLLASCATQQPLEVRTSHLRDVRTDYNIEPMVRGETLRRMHGAVGIREQEQRLGVYYDVEWRDAAVGEGVRVVFEYQQAATASRVLKLEREFGADETHGHAEFAVIGDAYLKGGRVLAWKCSLFRGESEVASRQSYLWR